MISNEKDIIEAVVSNLKHGGGKTFNVGFNIFSNFYNILLGSCTDWTGYPTSGKTELLLEVLVNMATFYDHKSLLYMPDAGTEAEVTQDLITKYSGKQFDEFYTWKGQKYKVQNRITEKEIMRYGPEVLQNFKFFESDTKSLTPVKFWEFCWEYKKKNGLHYGVADSWNYFSHDVGSLRYDQWLENTLSTRNQIAEKSGLHFHTVIHPKSPTMTKEGNVPRPTAHSLKGGSEWFNNGKSIIIVDRPNKGVSLVDIVIAKAKPRIVGGIGEFNMSFDVQSRRYYKDTGLQKIYASKEEHQFIPQLTEF